VPLTLCLWQPMTTIWPSKYDRTFCRCCCCHGYIQAPSHSPLHNPHISLSRTNHDKNDNDRSLTERRSSDAASDQDRVSGQLVDSLYAHHNELLAVFRFFDKKNDNVISQEEFREGRSPSFSPSCPHYRCLFSTYICAEADSLRTPYTQPHTGCRIVRRMTHEKLFMDKEGNRER